MNLRIALEKMIAEQNREALKLLTEMLFREHVDRVLDRVGRHNLAVVAGSVRGSEIAIEQRRNFDLLDPMDRAVTQNLQDADAHLAITMSDKLRHCLSWLIHLVR